MYGNQMACCGVVEFDGLLEHKTPQQALSAIYLDMEYEQEWRKAYIIFTDHCRCRKGAELARLIKRLKIGPVTSFRRKMNPNSGNHIRVWVWDFNKKAFKRYMDNTDYMKKRRAAKEKYDKEYSEWHKNYLAWCAKPHNDREPMPKVPRLPDILDY